MCKSLNNIIMKKGIDDSKGRSKVECPLGNSQEMSQGPCVTVTQEEWKSSTVKMSEK